ncbi:MAG TPA: sulfatase [Thermoanaerobaculia bacterium]|nr:sulfatase [Thermoanaerobaculia bacterium]
MRRVILATLAVVALVGFGAGGCRQGARGAQREGQAASLRGAARGWSVVLLTIDTLRADRLGAYGYRQRASSPRLDAQLGSGVVFEQAMSQRAATWPSLASLLSGLYPSGHGVDENGYGFPDQLPTLPKLLHGAGYRTGAFLANMCDANHQGWDAFSCEAGKDGRTVQDALAWAGGLDRGRPFLLWVHMFGAHGPYYNGGDLAARLLDPGYRGSLGPKKWRLDEVMTQRLRLDAADLRHLDALYDAAVMGSDGLAGSLLDGLRSGGMLDRALVVVTADHGEELYAHHGYLYHACSVYQTALHVPLAFAAPGLLPPGARVRQTVELIDIAPTILALLGVTAPARFDGKSLVPYLERPASGGAGRPAFSEYGTTRVHTVIDGRWKLIDNPDLFDPICIPKAPPHHFPIGRDELYDLELDPRESQNLAAANPTKVAELAQLVSLRFSALPHRAPRPPLDEKLRKQLTDLGYIAH